MSNTSKSGERRPPIAIIGLSGLYPRAETLEAFHHNMSAGLDCVTPLSVDRQTYSAIPGNDPIESGHLNRVDLFDHELFGLSKGEAEHMDPQHRLILEQTCFAIQNAGYSLRALRGSRTAVILAQGIPSYYTTYLYPSVSAASAFGNQPAMLTARVSYLLGLRGPAMLLDTTCSASLMAVHEACNKLWLDEADCAIAGGVSLKTDFDAPKAHWGAEILASSRRSKTFDAAADGTGLAEAVGVVLLKPLARALEDGDHVHAVLLGSAANNDGERSNGMTSPNAEAQTEVVLRAWKNAGVRADDVSYIEAHGTGTRVGDPIEARGLTAAFATQTERTQFCALSSLKSVIGHAGVAAGIASLTRVVLALKHKKLYPTLHFQTLNPLIDLGSSALYVNDRLRDWDPGAGPRRATPRRSCCRGPRSPMNTKCRCRPWATGSSSARRPIAQDWA
ncbi:MAG: polyketide synthase, partial [Myxococcales bacterium]|nr:polyketide synthase [Myxococcales bacterium]